MQSQYRPLPAPPGWKSALTQAFSPAVLRIKDDSARHAGHAGAQPGGQTHYSVLLVSEAFRGMSRVARDGRCMPRWLGNSGLRKRAGCMRWR